MDKYWSRQEFIHSINFAQDAMHTLPPPIPHQRIRCPVRRVAVLGHRHHLEHGLSQALGLGGLRVGGIVSEGAGGEFFR